MGFIEGRPILIQRGSIASGVMMFLFPCSPPNDVGAMHFFLMAFHISKSLQQVTAIGLKDNPLPAHSAVFSMTLTMSVTVLVTAATSFVSFAVDAVVASVCCSSLVFTALVKASEVLHYIKKILKKQGDKWRQRVRCRRQGRRTRGSRGTENAGRSRNRGCGGCVAEGR